MAQKAKTKLAEWQKRAFEGGTCEKCGWRVSKLSVDHIVPVFFLDSFDETGEAKYEDENNFQLICYPCNQAKAGRFDRANPKTIPIMLKYLRKGE